MHLLPEDDVMALNRVMEFLREHPTEVHRVELRELRAYLLSNGASLPPHSEERAENDTEEPDDVSEPDADLWSLEDLSADDMPSVTSGDPTPEDEETAASLKAEAADYAANGNTEEAIKRMTQALRLVPAKAMYWSQRALYLLNNKQPNAALRDASRALDINPQNVRALRVRGTVNRHLGQWESALKDLSEAQTIDYDEDINDLLRAAEEKVQARRVRRRRLATEKAEKEQHRQDALRRQREEELRKEKEEKEERQREFASQGAGGFPGAGGGMPPDMTDIFNDPEIAAAATDPEVLAKLQTLMRNPMESMQMMSDPKMSSLITKIMSKGMGGAGGGGAAAEFPPSDPGDGGGGSNGGFPSAAAGGAAPESKPLTDELD